MAVFACTEGVHTQSASTYRFAFPEPQHHWMQVEATFTDLPPTPLELRMSRSSPGRYSLHDFAKNVYDVHANGPDGQELPLSRPDPHGWTVPAHGDTVVVRYKVFGDRVDGTYLAIDTTHAQSTCRPRSCGREGWTTAAFTLTFEPPAGSQWQVATQLHPGATIRFEFTRAEPAVPDGQPDRVRSGVDASVRRSIGHTFRFVAAPHGHGRRARRASSQTSRRSFVAGAASLRRVPDYEPGALHVPRRLPALGQRRRHGAPQQHGHHLVERASAATAPGCSTRWRTSSSTAGTSSASARRRSSRSTSSARTCRASCGSREGFTQYYGPLVAEPRRPGATSRRRSDDLAEPHRAAWRSTRPRSALGRRDEPDGGVHRRRPDRSTAPTGRTPTSRTTRSAAPSRWRST